MKGLIKRLCTGFLALATIATSLPTSVHASEKQYWTDGKTTAGVIEKVMNDGSIEATFHESLMTGTMSRIRTHLIDTFFIFKTSFVIVRRFIVTMTVNPNCIVKCFDIFKYHLVCHLIINDLFSIQPLSFN